MKIILADHTHNQELCHLSSLVSVPGSMEIGYLREPDYFAALDTQGPFHQTIIGIEKNRVYGSGSRSIRYLYINGKKTSVGYLGGLRVHPEYRGSIFLAMGYKFLKELNRDGRTPIHFTTIIEENKTAIDALVGGRGGLPWYKPIGNFVTQTILLNRHTRQKTYNDFSIETGSPATLSEITEFLNKEGKDKQLFPCYKEEDFNTSLFRNFKPENWYIARQNNKIIGILGAWDQNDFKKYQIKSYSRFMKIKRPVINLFARLTGYRPLPPSGNQVKLLYAYSPLVEKNNTRVLKGLIDRILFDYRKSPFSGLVIGFMDNDPLQKSLSGLPSVEYRSILYLVYWDEQKDYFEKIDQNRLFHLEPGLL